MKKIQQQFLMVFIVLSSLSLLYIETAKAQGFGPSCQMTRGSRFNFFISPENQNSGLFGSTADRIPPVVISNCRAAAGKVLGLSLGLRFPYLVSDAADISVDGSLRADSCKIQDNPFSSEQSFQERRDHFDNQFRLLRQCAYLELTHLDGKPIQFNPSQQHCKLTKLPDGKVKAEGDFCYVRVNPDLRLVVGIALREECKDPSFLAEAGLRPADLDAMLQAFVVDDDTSLVTQNLIGSAKVRVLVTPNSKEIPVVTDFGPDLPYFPSTFSADIHMGPMTIQEGSQGDDKRTFFDLGLLVDTRAWRSCKDKSCVGAGDYQQPMAGEIEFAEITAKGREVLDSWYGGSISDPFVKSQWQGIFRFSRKSSEGVEVHIGKTYEIKIDFYNPYDDYLMLIKGFEQMLVDLTLLNGTPGFDIIQPINSLRSLLGLPEVPSLPSMGKVDIDVELEKVRQAIEKLGNSMVYPPFYTTLCNLAGDRCRSTNESAKYLTLITRFKVTGVNPGDGSYTLSDVSMRRESPLLGSYSKPLAQVPRLVCQ